MIENELRCIANLVFAEEKPTEVKKLMKPRLDYLRGY